MPPTDPERPRRGRRGTLLGILFVVALPALVAVCGPATSGALFLLRPAPDSPVAHDLPADYAPRHHGGIDLPTGLYVRRNEDLVIGGTPALILRRTYRTRDGVQRWFGVGGSHPGERYLSGDIRDLSRVALITAEGSRVEFERTSFGRFLANAMYEHRGGREGYQGARLGWTGLVWALRHPDGALSRYQACGPNAARSCSIESDRDADGHMIHYRRDAESRLARMETDDHRWMDFRYDQANRIARVVDSLGRHVDYSYDEGGRLVLARASSGVERRYTYTDAHELKTIDEPGIRIENVYENGRCVRQLNWLPGRSVPYVFEFTYRLEGEDVVETLTRESSGAWSKLTFDRDQVTSDERGYGDTRMAKVGYDRDEHMRVWRVTVECVDAGGRPISAAREVEDDAESALESLVRTHCAPPRVDAPSASR